VVLGIRDIKPTPSGQMILGVLNGDLPGYLDSTTNVVDVDDVARGHILAARKGRIGERYILGNENITIKDFFGMIAEIAGLTPPKKVAMPTSLLLLFGYLNQAVAGITGKTPLIVPSSIRTMSKPSCYDCSKAVNELGMPQTPIRETIEKAVNWFRENGYVKAV
jgi:dihydroflavonol-4-reductase